MKTFYLKLLSTGVIRTSIQPGRLGVIRTSIQPRRLGVIRTSIQPRRLGVIQTSIQPRRLGVIRTSIQPRRRFSLFGRLRRGRNPFRMTTRSNRLSPFIQRRLSTTPGTFRWNNFNNNNNTNLNNLNYYTSNPSMRRREPSAVMVRSVSRPSTSAQEPLVVQTRVQRPAPVITVVSSQALSKRSRFDLPKVLSRRRMDSLRVKAGPGRVGHKGPVVVQIMDSLRVKAGPARAGHKGPVVIGMDSLRVKADPARVGHKGPVVVQRMDSLRVKAGPARAGHKGPVVVQRLDSLRVKAGPGHVGHKGPVVVQRLDSLRVKAGPGHVEHKGPVVVQRLDSLRVKAGPAHVGHKGPVVVQRLDSLRVKAGPAHVGHKGPVVVQRTRQGNPAVSTDVKSRPNVESVIYDVSNPGTNVVQVNPSQAKIVTIASPETEQIPIKPHVSVTTAGIQPHVSNTGVQTPGSPQGDAFQQDLVDVFTTVLEGYLAPQTVQPASQTVVPLAPPSTIHQQPVQHFGANTQYDPYNPYGHMAAFSYMNPWMSPAMMQEMMYGPTQDPPDGVTTTAAPIPVTQGTANKSVITAEVRNVTVPVTGVINTKVPIEAAVKDASVVDTVKDVTIETKASQEVIKANEVTSSDGPLGQAEVKLPVADFNIKVDVNMKTEPIPTVSYTRSPKLIPTIPPVPVTAEVDSAPLPTETIQKGLVFTRQPEIYRTISTILKHNPDAVKKAFTTDPTPAINLTIAGLVDKTTDGVSSIVNITKDIAFPPALVDKTTAVLLDNIDKPKDGLVPTIVEGTLNVVSTALDSTLNGTSVVIDKTKEAILTSAPESFVTEIGIASTPNPSVSVPSEIPVLANVDVEGVSSQEINVKSTIVTNNTSQSQTNGDGLHEQLKKLRETSVGSGAIELGSYLSDPSFVQILRESLLRLTKEQNTALPSNAPQPETTTSEPVSTTTITATTTEEYELEDYITIADTTVEPTTPASMTVTSSVTSATAP